MNETEVESPCIGICTLITSATHSERICTGCFRAVSEIAGWRRWPAEKRRAVLELLPRRREALLDSLRPAIDD
jgi:predicted Fe-S protein YdhL (DUF1289 family)